MRARKILTAPLRGAKSLTRMIFRPQSWAIFRSSRHGFDVSSVGDGTASSTVMAPLLWIQRNFPEAPVKIDKELDGGELEPQINHKMLKVLRRPNPFYSGTTLWMATLADWYVSGNAYWLKIRNGVGEVEQLWWVPSVLIEPVGDDKTFVTHYAYSPSGEVKKIDVEDVVHFRFGLDPDNQLVGRSPLASVLREVFTDDEAAKFTAGLLRNSGVPGVVISPKEGTIPDEDVKATKDYVSSEFVGDRRGEPLVMSGPTNVEQFGFSPAQLDLKALRRLPEERVTAVLGIAAIVAGLGAGLDRSTFANFSEAREAAYQENIIPSQRIMGEELEFQLLPDFEDDPFQFRVGFDTSKVRVLQEDEVKRAQRLDVGVRGGWVRVGEARRQMGLEADTADDIYLRSFATIEVGTGESGRTLELEAGNEQRLLTAGNTNRGRVKQQTRSQANLIIALERRARTLAGNFADELEDDFVELGKIAEKAFRDVVPADALDTEKAAERGFAILKAVGAVTGDAELDEPAKLKLALKASDEQIAAQVVNAMNVRDWEQTRAKATYAAAYAATATDTVTTVNKVLDLGLDLPDPVMRRVIFEGGTRLALLETSRQTQHAVIRAVAEGRREGWGPIEVGRRIRSEVPAGRFVNAGPKYRAELIARTETKHAQNVSSIETYKAAPTVTGVVAFDARLGDSDEDCEQRDGMTFTFEQAEVEMLEEHPNGTLSFAPIVAENLETVGA